MWNCLHVVCRLAQVSMKKVTCCFNQTTQWYPENICGDISRDQLTWRTYGGFLSHRGTPSHHPIIDGVFHEINQPFLGYPHDSGNPHIENKWYNCGDSLTSTCVNMNLFDAFHDCLAGLNPREHSSSSPVDPGRGPYTGTFTSYQVTRLSTQRPI